MARSRNIKPGLAQNEYLAELGPLTQLFFALLPTIADKEGRLEDRPRKIKAQLFPYYDANCDAMLSQLALPLGGIDAKCDDSFIIRYEIEGQKYIQIRNFATHQSPHYREIESVIPDYSDVESTSSQRQVNVGQPSANSKVKGISNKESVTRNQDGFDLFWSEVPNKTDKGKARTAYAKAIKKIAGRENDPSGFLLERMKAFARSDKAKGDFCPYPATWLNGERYDDDPATWKQKDGTKTANDIGPGQRHDPSVPCEPPRTGW